MIILCIFLFELVTLFLISQSLTRALSQLFFRLTKSEAVTIHLLSFLFLPGVIIHELAHFLMASILFVPTGEIEFMPQVTKDTVKLGSVAIGRTDPIRRALIGLAPFLVGVTILLGSLFYVTSFYSSGEPVEIWKIVLLIYILFEVTNTMFSSKKDVEGTVEIVGALMFLGIIFYMLGGRIPVAVIAWVNSSEFMQGLRYIISLLFFPLGIDILALLITKMFVYKR